MKRLFVIMCYASLMSCQDKVICPAFQSTYILDDSTRNAYFSYVWQLDENTRSQYLAQQTGGEDSEDSISTALTQPRTDYYAYAGEKVVPWRVQKRTKYGIIKHTPYPIKLYQLRTAPMENVLAPEPISNEFVASDFADSLMVDSLSLAMDSTNVDSVAITKEKETIRFLYDYDPSDNFNVEQEYYNKYYSYKFIDNRPEPEPKPADTTATVPDSLQTKEPFFKRIFNFKKLFKKKEKEEPSEELPEETDPQLEEPAEGTINEEEEEGSNGG